MNNRVNASTVRVSLPQVKASVPSFGTGTDPTFSPRIHGVRAAPFNGSRTLPFKRPGAIREACARPRQTRACCGALVSPLGRRVALHFHYPEFFAAGGVAPGTVVQASR